MTGTSKAITRPCSCTTSSSRTTTPRCRTSTTVKARTSGMGLAATGGINLSSSSPALRRQPQKRKTSATTRMLGLPRLRSTRECSLCWTPALLRAKGCRPRLTIPWPRLPAHCRSLSTLLAPSTLMVFVRVSKVAILTFSRRCKPPMFWQVWVVLGWESNLPACAISTARTSTTTPHRQCRRQTRLRVSESRTRFTVARLPVLIRGSRKVRTS